MELPATMGSRGMMSLAALVLILLAVAFFWYQKKQKKPKTTTTSCNLPREPKPVEVTGEPIS
jgi:cbb3-type cytochrome oxidase subunit 3